MSKPIIINSNSRDDHGELVTHMNVGEWAKEAVCKYNIFPRSVQEIQWQMNPSKGSAEEVCEDTRLGPELLTSVSKSSLVNGRQLAIIADLHGGLYLARSFDPTAKVVFIVLDERRPGIAVFAFEWDCRLYWSILNWPIGGIVDTGVTHYRGPLPEFYCKVSADGAYAVLVGPCDSEKSPDMFVPSAKLLHRDSWSIMNLMLGELDNELWPTLLDFDPRPAYIHCVTMICVDQPSCSFSHLCYYDGFLLRCDVSSLSPRTLPPLHGATQPGDQVFTLWPGPVHGGHTNRETSWQMAREKVGCGLLAFVKEGAQLLCSSSQRDYHCGFSLYASNTLELLIVLDISTERLACHWEYARMHAQYAYSACYRSLSIIMWSVIKKNDKNTNIISDAVTARLPYIGDHVPSLQHRCRAIMRSHITPAVLSALPLPPRLQNFIEGWN